MKFRQVDGHSGGVLGGFCGDGDVVIDVLQRYFYLMVI